MHIQERHGHILRDLKLRRGHSVGCDLVGADGTGLHLASSHAVRGQLIRIDRTGGELVRGHGISRNLPGLNLMHIQERHGHILRHAELRGRDAVGRQFVGGDGERDDVARLHAVRRQLASCHRVGHKLLRRDRVGGELVHRDGVRFDFFGGHGVGSEMLRSNRARSQNVIGYEVEWFEARAIPRQDFHHAVRERH